MTCTYQFFIIKLECTETFMCPSAELTWVSSYFETSEPSKNVALNCHLSIHRCSWFWSKNPQFQKRISQGLASSWNSSQLSTWAHKCHSYFSVPYGIMSNNSAFRGSSPHFWQHSLGSTIWRVWTKRRQITRAIYLFGEPKRKPEEEM